MIKSFKEFITEIEMYNEAKVHAADLKRNAGTKYHHIHFDPLKNRSAAYVKDVSRHYFGSDHRDMNKVETLKRLEKAHKSTLKFDAHVAQVNGRTAG